MFRLVLAALVASAVGFAPSVGVQRTVVRAATPTMQFGGSALDGINEELKKVKADMDDDDDKPMTKAELKKMEKEAFAEMKKLKEEAAAAAKAAE